MVEDENAVVKLAVKTPTPPSVMLEQLYFVCSATVPLVRVK